MLLINFEKMFLKNFCFFVVGVFSVVVNVFVIYCDFFSDVNILISD